MAENGMRAWEKQIARELKGKPFEKILWHLEPGLTLHPFPDPSSEGVKRGRALISKISPLANSSETSALFPIYDRASFDFFTSNQTESPLSPLLIGPLAPFPYPEGKRETFKLLEKNPPLLQKPYQAKGFLRGDPLSINSSHCDALKYQPMELDEISFIILMDEIKNGDFSPFSGKFFEINISHFRTLGSGLVEELAWSLSLLAELFSRGEEIGWTAEKLATSLYFELSLGEGIFLDIARILTLKSLSLSIIKPYGNFHIPCRVHSSGINLSLSDPYNNLIRQTFETFSALLGGADFLVPLPFETGLAHGEPYKNPLIRNIPLVLKKEAFLEEGGPPIEGSVYIESLVGNLSTSVWESFLTLEKQGGFYDSLKKGTFKTALLASKNRRLVEFRTGKKIQIGVNKFPPPPHLENQLPWKEGALLQKKNRTQNFLIPGMEFENLKEMGHLLKGPPPLLIGFGETRFRSARENFSRDFFNFLGIEVLSIGPFANLKGFLPEIISSLKKNQPPLVVFCGDDASYLEEVGSMTTILKSQGGVKGVLAGNPGEHRGKWLENRVEFFIHQGMDFVAVLTEILGYLKGEAK